MPTSRSRSIYVFCLAAVWSTCILLIEAACPSGWTTGSSANRCHKVFSQTSQFDDVNAARDVCRQKGADLATITNSTEETIIAGIIKGLDNSVTDVYIGAIATVDPSLYSWLDNETAFIYQASSEPYNASDIRHVADRCVTLYSEDGSWINTVWRRIPCCFRSNITAVACTKPSDDNLLASDNTVVDFCFGACPSGSFRLNDKCYKIKQESQSFNSIYFAQLSCNQDGYRLADSIPDIVFDHVVSILKQMAVPTGVVVYTGLNNLTSANTFVTVDGSSYSEASLLAIDKCSYNSSNDKCITLMTRSSTWDVFSTIYCPRQCCSDLGITYVACEKPITSEINQDDNDVFGMTCYGDIDECNSNPCSNVATCQNKILKYNCLCPEGYTGVGCETVIDNCESDPCQNGQNCTTYIGHYVCECEPGYEGVNCETDIDECANITCLHGGTCVDKVNSAVCDCPGQFTGNFCETLILCQSFDQDVANGTVKMSGTNEAGDQIDIVCEDGLLLKDRSPNKTLTCLSSTGEWDYPLDQLGNCASP
ncbi:hypothetical protein LSH36_361g04018 [Paralvinella palmiformis]|uniref:Uncharacterized protein n=1 Tax=Paralvinella palmiformis TaxID=53620 RepID=A0AAD9JE47_9ANNE|nr:hypothetical protein LSH36_361g04018 [Paralvinella palmiformis]